MRSREVVSEASVFGRVFIKCGGRTIRVARAVDKRGDARAIRPSVLSDEATFLDNADSPLGRRQGRSSNRLCGTAPDTPAVHAGVGLVALRLVEQCSCPRDSGCVARFGELVDERSKRASVFGRRTVAVA